MTSESYGNDQGYSISPTSQVRILPHATQIKGGNNGYHENGKSGSTKTGNRY